MNTAQILDVTDFDRPSDEILLDLINAANDFRVPRNKIVFGTPFAVDQRPDIPADMNTFIPCDFDQAWDSRFPGQNGFLYRRLELSSLLVDESVQIAPAEVPAQVYELLDQINQKLHTQLTMLDLENDTIIQGQPTVGLRAKPGSQNWIGTVNLEILTGVPTGARLTEDGRIRITEDGRIRVIEAQA